MFYGVLFNALSPGIKILIQQMLKELLSVNLIDGVKYIFEGKYYEPQ